MSQEQAECPGCGDCVTLESTGFCPQCRIDGAKYFAKRSIFYSIILSLPQVLLIILLPNNVWCIIIKILSGLWLLGYSLNLITSPPTLKRWGNSGWCVILNDILFAIIVLNFVIGFNIWISIVCFIFMFFNITDMYNILNKTCLECYSRPLHYPNYDPEDEYYIDDIKYPSAPTLSDWLQNMYDLYMRKGTERLEKNSSDLKILTYSNLKLLSYFTLANSSRSSKNILKLCPKAVPIIGLIFREYRLYYECFWQYILLCRYDVKYTKKISSLYALVGPSTESELAILFPRNPRVAELLKCVIADDYKKLFRKAIITYIHGEHDGGQVKDPKMLLTVNGIELTSRLDSILRKKNIIFDPMELTQYVCEETEQGFKCILLKNYNLGNDDRPILPEEMLEEI